MASVLGKRTRQALNASDESAPSSPSKRRQTRQTALKIYEDAQDSAPAISTRRSIRSDIETSKCDGQNKEIQHDSHHEIHVERLGSDEGSKENLPPTFATPTTKRFRDAFSTTVPLTPRRRVLLGGKLVTPRSQRRVDKLPSSNIFAAARQLFSQSGSHGRIIGRQAERDQLLSFISNGLDARKGGCLYISGPPGTGKSALVQEILQHYREDERARVSIVNCITTKTMSEVTTQLSQDWSVPLKDGSDLAKTFTKRSPNGVHIVLMDEIDSLLDGDCEFLYSLFEWSLHRTSSLLLIGIANALDLTDRFMPRLKSRNLKPQLLPFMPYSAADMSSIITSKLCTLLGTETTVPGFVPIIHPAAIKLIGSKVAAQTGDLRKAFSLARRSIEQVERDTQEPVVSSIGTPTKDPLAEMSNGLPTPPRMKPALDAETAPRVTISHVARLATSIFGQGATSRLAALNLQQKAVLCSVVAAESRQAKRDPFKTPSKSAKKIPDVQTLYEKYGRMCQQGDGLLPVLKHTEFRDVVASLETLGLLHEAIGRGSSMLTPSKTPARSGKNLDERRYVSVVSQSEMRESLEGPGADLLQRFMIDE